MRIYDPNDEKTVRAFEAGEPICFPPTEPTAPDGPSEADDWPAEWHRVGATDDRGIFAAPPNDDAPAGRTAG